jgi:hypothetical protein
VTPPDELRDPHEGFSVHQEEDVIATRSIVRIAASAIVVGALGVGVAWLVLRAGGSAPQDAAAMVPAMAPRSIAGVEQTPIWQAEDGLALRAQQRAELRSWGWADRDAGVARIPIDRAKDLVVERAP